MWLGDIPPEAAVFTRLTLLCFLIDFTPGSLNILEQANGHIRKYYLITSGVAAICFPLSYLAFKLGAPVWSGYIIYICVYVFKAVAMLSVAHSDTGFPVRAYLRKALLPMLSAALPSGLAALSLWAILPAAWWRFLVTAAAGAFAALAGIWLFGLTEGEKTFVKSRISFLK